MDQAARSALAERAVEAGAYRAFVLPVLEVPFDAGLRAYCEENRCGAYGKNYACPPCVGTAEQTIAQARAYQYALVFQTVGMLEDSFDFEGMMEASKTHERISNQLFQALREELPGCLTLSAGGCKICEKCAKVDEKPCRFPGQAVSSLEAYCVNVSALAEKCEMKYINGQNTVTYFSAVFFRSEN